MRQPSVFNIAKLEDWTKFDPSGGWTSNCTYSGRWKRIGSEMLIEIYVLCSAAPSGALTLNIPDGYTMDLPYSTSRSRSVGVGYIYDQSINTTYPITVSGNDTSSVKLWYFNAAAAETKSNPVSHNTPITFINLDTVFVRFSVPISGWSANEA